MSDNRSDMRPVLKLNMHSSDKEGLHALTGGRLHVLSLKIASLSCLFAIGYGTTWFVLTPDAALWIVMVLVLGSFFSTYFVATHFLSKRLELARNTLKRIRKHKFGQLERARYPRGDELNALIRQVHRSGLLLESEISELRKVENYRREFVGNISHELKTPLFAIQGFAETLLEGAIEDESVNRAFVEHILKNAKRLTDLARDLMEISRLEKGEQPLNFEPFDIGRLITEVIDSHEPIALKHRVTVHASFSDDLSNVLGDAQHIRQVLVNLIDNAIKYSNSESDVFFSAVEAADSMVDIRVKDSGIGVAKKYIPRITERFFRVDKSRSRSAGGTGLGLAIVKHILAAHRQPLNIESTPGMGSTFSFHLPAAGGRDPTR